MSSLGIYFGPKVISITESRGKSIASTAQILQSSITTGDLGEKLPAELKASEIVALLKDELRRNRITAKEACICLSGKDLIIRNFELPALPREELHSAVNFEAKKYIPFKVEDIVAASQAEFDKVSQHNEILYMGIKKDALEKYVSIFAELGIKLSRIEYSAFSVLRILDIARVSKRGVIAVVEADLQEQDEASFTVLENDFPIFSRDISLSAGPEEFGAKAEAASPQKSLDKARNEIRVSLDYYRRKFAAKPIQKIYLVCNPEYRSELEASIIESGFQAQFLEVAKYIGKAGYVSLSLVKSYSASLAKMVKTSIKLDLLGAKERPKQLKAAAEEEAAGLEGLIPDKRLIAVAVLICAAVFAFGYFYRVMPLQDNLNQVIAKRVTPATVSPAVPLAQLEKVDKDYKDKLAVLDNLIRKQFYATSPLSGIPRNIPADLWLTRFNLSTAADGKQLLTLEGVAYAGDADKEFSEVNKFASDMKDDAQLANAFKDISITSIDRKVRSGETAVTTFTIVCTGK